MEPTSGTSITIIPCTGPNKRTGVVPARHNPRLLGSFQFVFSSHLP